MSVEIFYKYLLITIKSNSHIDDLNLFVRTLIEAHVGVCLFFAFLISHSPFLATSEGQEDELITLFRKVS